MNPIIYRRYLSLTDTSYVLYDSKIMQWFLDHGPSPNARCNLDYTPMVAAAIAPTPVIEYLFEYGASVQKSQLLWHDVNRQSDDRFRVLDLLLSRGAKLNDIKYARDQASFALYHRLDLCTPLHCAVDLK